MSKSKFPGHLKFAEGAARETDTNGNEHVWVPMGSEPPNWLRMGIQSEAGITQPNEDVSALAVRIQEFRELRWTRMQKLFKKPPDDVIDAPVGPEGAKIPLVPEGKSRKAFLVWAQQNGLSLKSETIAKLFPDVIKKRELLDAKLLELNTNVSFQKQDLPKETHHSKEMPELAAEHQRLQSALDEAVRLNLITLEQFGDPSDKECLILPSYHWTEDDILGRFQDTEKEKSTALSQYQMFAFTYLLQKHNLTSPLFVEGLEVGSKPNRFSFTVLADTPISIYSRDGQAVLFEDPDYYMKVSNPQRRGFILNFSDVTSYEYIQGSHDQSVVFEVQKFLENEVAVLRTFANAYSPSGKFQGPPQAVEESGKIKILFNGISRDPKTVVEECDAGNYAFQRHKDGLRKISDLRDQEFVKHIIETVPPKIPMAWMGLAHAESVKELCLKQGLKVCLAIPNASLRRLREIRSTQNLDQGHKKTREEMLRDFAAKYI